MKLAAGVIFIKLFWCYLCCYQLIALHLDSDYAASGINYAEKSFMKLAADINFVKRFGAIYAATGLLPTVLTQAMPPGI
jgi:hypothetical protein